MPSPGVRVTVAESLSRELVKVSEWCDLWGMKLNASKTKTMIVSRSRTMHPQSLTLTIGRTVMKESDDLVMLGVNFEFKMTFEKHLRSVSRAATQRLGIFRKSWQVFPDRLLLGRCFAVLSCPFLSTVLQCGARRPIHTLNYSTVCLVSDTRFLTGCVFECGLEHRRSVAVLCMLYKIRCNLMHPLYGSLPDPYVPVSATHGAVIVHRYTYAPPRCRTSQYRRTFIPLSVSLWNNMVTLYSMVWDWRISRAGLIPFYWRSCSVHVCLVLFLFSISLLSFYWLVLWG